MILNPGYRAKGLSNDLAVVQLDTPVIINDYIRPICLGILKEKSGLLIGFEIKQKGRSDDLSHVNLDIVSECKDQSKDLEGLLSDNVVCGKYSKGKFLKSNYFIENI